MPRPRKVSESQLSCLVDLMQDNRNLALGYTNTGPLGNQTATNSWQQIAVTLNSMGDGDTKSPGAWKTYWHELKYRTKSKAAQLRQHAAGTGGGPCKKSLCEIDLKIINIMGVVAIHGNSEAQVPFQVPTVRNEFDIPNIEQIHEPTPVLPL